MAWVMVNSRMYSSEIHDAAVMLPLGVDMRGSIRTQAVDSPVKFARKTRMTSPGTSGIAFVKVSFNCVSALSLGM
eukprot:3537974-Rhodomonas_salina.2